MFQTPADRSAWGGISRRAVIASLGAAGFAAAALGQESKLVAPALPQPGAAPGPAVDLNGAGFYRFKLGTFTLTVLTDGTMPMGGNAGGYPMFGANATKEDVDAAAAEAMIPPAKLLGHVHGLLIDSGEGDAGRVLIDTGCGSGMGPTTGRLVKSLATAGFTPAQVGHLVITHAHPDHTGGLLEAGFGVFPSTQFYAAKAEVDFWTGNPDLSKAHIPQNMKDVMVERAKGLFAALNEGALKPRFHQLGDGDKIIDGVKLMLCAGHTPGHSAVAVVGGSEQFVYMTDVVHHAGIQMPHPDWHVAYDTDPVMAAKSRRAMLTRVAAEKTLVSGAHLPFPAVGYVRKEGSGFAWVPRVWEW